MGHFRNSGCDSCTGTMKRRVLWDLFACEPVRHVCSLQPAVSCQRRFLAERKPSILSTRSYLCRGVSTAFIRPYLKSATCLSCSHQIGRMFNEPRSDGKRAFLLCVHPGINLMRPPQRLTLKTSWILC